jgi:hypothetical protein
MPPAPAWKWEPKHFGEDEHGRSVRDFCKDRTNCNVVIDSDSRVIRKDRKDETGVAHAGLNPITDM